MVQEMLQAQVFEDLQVVAVKKNVSHVSLERPAAKRDSYFSWGILTFAHFSF